MNIYTLHRGVSRALCRAGRIADSDGSSSRRRLLWARGEQMYTMSVERGDRCATAILDPKGIVVSWHDRLPNARLYDHGVVSRHMSQFYLPEDVALFLPSRHLSIAAEHGIDTHRGWRRRPGGEIFWGVTVIQSLRLNDGELLGYSHMTRLVRAPGQFLSRSPRAGLQQTASFAMTA